MFRRKSGTYVLPTQLVHLAAVALFASLAFNFISIFLECDVPRFFQKEVTGEPKFLPVDVQTVAMTVDDSERYGVNDDGDWSTIIPNHGFVLLDSPSEEADENGRAFYAVSMYHQLHCLNGFRRLTVAAKNGTVNQHNVDHAVHCLSYLRQLLLCQADTALEPARLATTVSGGKTQAVYGEGTTHQCRDWTQVRSFVENNYKLWKDKDHFETSESKTDHTHDNHTHTHTHGGDHKEPMKDHSGDNDSHSHHHDHHHHGNSS